MEKLQIINLSNYIRPEIREVAGKKWVLNGDKNSFYQTIIDAYNGSPTNSAIIDSYSQFIYGKGLTSDDKAKKPSEWAAIMSLVSKKDLRKICKDFEMFGEASIEVKYINNKIQRCFHIAKQRIAPEVANEEGDITGYYYSYDFSNVNKYKPERFDAFGYGEGLNERSEIYIFRDYQVGQFYYSNPSYVSGISWARMEEEISNYSVNHIQKGLSFGHIINMNCGIQESAETIQENTRQIRNHLTGSQNAGAFFLNWNDNKDSEITISALEVSDAHQQYAYLSTEARQQLCTSHKLTSPMLVGIKEANGFSSNAEEIKVGFAELMINVIRPKQEIILDGLMEVFAVNGITLDLQFESLRAEEVLAEIVTDSTGAEVATVTNDAAVSYNGAQISSAIDIFAKVREGILTTEQAIVFLVQFLNIPVGVAQSLFSNQSAPLTQLASQHVCCSKDDNGLSEVADALIEMGEILNEDEWIEIDAIPVTKELEIK
jgi:capsid portal protein